MDNNPTGGNFGTGTGGSMSGANAGGSIPTTNPTGTNPATGGGELTPSSFGTTTGTESGGVSSGIVSILEKFGVSETQLNTVRETLKNVNIDQSLDKAKETVTDSITKAREYAKKNPGAVVAGLAVLVIGAGLIAAAASRKDNE